MKFALLLLVFGVIVAIAASSRRAPRSAQRPALDEKQRPESTFSPDPSNDKEIFVSGWNEDELQRILHSFERTYQGGGYGHYIVEREALPDGGFRLTFPQDLHPQLFVFLVNFLAYPLDVPAGSNPALVAGRSSLNADYLGMDLAFSGQRALFYVPADDQDYDRVYVKTESGTTLVQTFTSMRWRISELDRISEHARRLEDRDSGPPA